MRLSPAAGWVAVLLSSPVAWAQLPILHVEGKVLLDGRPIAITSVKFRGVEAPQYPGVNNGQILKADNGRAQVSSSLYLAENSSVKVLSDHSPDIAFEILSGRVIIARTGLAASVRYKEAIITLDKGGQWLIDANSGRLGVYGGSATVTYGVSLECALAGACRLVVGGHPTNTVEVKKGQQVALKETLPVSPFDQKENAAFKRWVRRRLSAGPPVLLSIGPNF